MRKLTRPTVDLRAIRRDLAFPGFKTTLNRLAGSGNAHHFQADFLGWKGHGRSPLCGGADAACPWHPSASHGRRWIGHEDPAPSTPTWPLRVTARTAPHSAPPRRGYQDGVNLPRPLAQPYIVVARGRPGVILSWGCKPEGATAPLLPSVRPPAVPVLDWVEQAPQGGYSLLSGLGR